MPQLLAHLWGDYFIQNDWMASNKTKSSWICLIHALSYVIPFLFLTLDWRALSAIAFTHFLIDRFTLANRAVKIKNWTWTNSGFPEVTPAYISFWVTVLVDNTFHLTINFFALKYWG